MPEPAEHDQKRLVNVELPRRRASWRLQLAHVVLGLTVRKFFDVVVWTHRRRLLPRSAALFVSRRFDRLGAVLRPPRGTRLQRSDFTDYKAEWVWDPAVADAPEAATGAVLYLHGGGLASCGLNTHRRIVARVSTATRLPVYNIEYRQVPEAHVTQAVDDCFRAYKRLLEIGVPAGRIVLAGDSAGGGLVFSTALAIRDAGLPTPAALVAIAPWVNYDSATRFAHPNDALDPVLSAGILSLPVTWSMHQNGELDPALSPVNHDFTGLPPTLIQVGSTEVLLPDAYEAAACCVRDSVPVRLQVWPKAIHVFHAGADVLPDAREAFEAIGAFVRETLATSPVDAAVDAERSA